MDPPLGRKKAEVLAHYRVSSRCFRPYFSLGSSGKKNRSNQEKDVIPSRYLSEDCEVISRRISLFTKNTFWLSGYPYADVPMRHSAFALADWRQLKSFRGSCPGHRVPTTFWFDSCWTSRSVSGKFYIRNLEDLEIRHFFCVRSIFDFNWLLRDLLNGINEFLFLLVS